jgi:ATP sulfurylase
MVNHLIRPHGGALVDLMVPVARATEIKAESLGWPSWDLTARQLCDLALLLKAASRLCGFMGRADYESVRTHAPGGRHTVADPGDWTSPTSWPPPSSPATGSACDEEA